MKRCHTWRCYSLAGDKRSRVKRHQWRDGPRFLQVWREPSLHRRGVVTGHHSETHLKLVPQANTPETRNLLSRHVHLPRYSCMLSKLHLQQVLLVLAMASALRVYVFLEGWYVLKAICFLRRSGNQASVILIITSSSRCVPQIQFFPRFWHRSFLRLFRIFLLCLSFVALCWWLASATVPRICWSSTSKLHCEA